MLTIYHFTHISHVLCCLDTSWALDNPALVAWVRASDGESLSKARRLRVEFLVQGSSTGQKTVGGCHSLLKENPSLD